MTTAQCAECSGSGLMHGYDADCRVCHGTGRVSVSDPQMTLSGALEWAKAERSARRKAEKRITELEQEIKNLVATVG